MLQTSKTFFADVVICGGGPAGSAAAISAAREGRSVLLLELRESLGGLCTNGYITGIAGVVNGISEEWLGRLNAEGHAVMRAHLPTVEPEYGKIMLEQMVLQSGARILYGVHVVDCEMHDGKLTSVICYCKQGRIEVRGSVFIDCTGDADLALAAGVPYEVGCAEFCGLNQSVTMGFRLSYVDLKKYQEAESAFRTGPDYDLRDVKRQRLIVFKEHQALANGDLHEILSPGNLVYPMPGDPTCADVTIDATHSFDCRCDDAVDLTRQIVDQHRKVVWFHEFLKKYVPGFENSRLTGLAPMNGIRDSRRVIGEYVFTALDIARAAKFEDGILQHTEFFDAHVPTPGFHTASRHITHTEPVEPAVCRPTQDEKDFMMHPFVPPLGWEIRTNPREWCEVPFRSLIARGADNLLVAGRCFSADYHANGSVRVIAPSMSMGQAAGIGASLFIASKLGALRELDGRLVRGRMIELGVKLDEAPGGYWKQMREAEGEIVVSGNDVAMIAKKTGREAVPFI